jgi:hypothetical protein
LTHKGSKDAEDRSRINRLERIGWIGSRGLKATASPNMLTAGGLSRIVKTCFVKARLLRDSQQALVSHPQG